MIDDSRDVVLMVLAIIGFSNLGAATGVFLITRAPQLAPPGVEFFWAGAGVLTLLARTVIVAWPALSGGEPA